MAEKRTMQPEDLFRLKFLQGGQLSPDGKQAVYAVAHVDAEQEAEYINLWLVDVKSGQQRPLTRGDWQDREPQWSPDGQQILYSAMLQPDSHHTFNAQPRIVSLDGQIRSVLPEGWGSTSGVAAWLPTGKQIAFIGVPEAAPLGAKSDLWVVDAQGGQPQNRTTGLAVGVGGGIQADMPVFVPGRLSIARDGKSALVAVQAEGMAQIYRIALSGKESYEPVLTGERSCMLLGTDAQHKALLYIVSTFNSPTELHVSDIEGGSERRLTQLNDDLLGQIALPTVENLRFPSADGTEVEGWILKPAIGQAPYPTVLYIHGGPFGAHGHAFSFDFHLLCGAGYATLTVNYRASMGYGDAFSTPVVGKWGTMDYQDLMAGVDFAIARGISDPDRLGVAGLSFGGYHTCWIVTQTERFKAAVPENPVVNWWTEYGVSDCVWYVVREMGGHPWEIPDVYRQCPPLTFAHQCKTPTLLIQGEHDWRCPTPESEQFYAVLKAVGCEVEMLRFPNSFHGGAIRGAVAVRRAQNAALLDWMNRHILGKPAAPGIV